MNLDAIEACKEMDRFIKELPQDHWDEAFDLFFRVKRALLSADECVETLNEPLKTNRKDHLMHTRMHLRIRDVCVEDEIFALLFEEYLGTQFSNEDHKREVLAGIRERFKEVYEQQADKIAAYREELGLVNPHED